MSESKIYIYQPDVITSAEVYPDGIPSTPKGYRLTGEFRPPVYNEIFIPVEGGGCVGPRLILERYTPTKLTAEFVECDPHEATHYQLVDSCVPLRLSNTHDRKGSGRYFKLVRIDVS